MSGSSQPVSRPPTSKSRGICRYYTTERGCFNGKRCKFVHGIPSDSSAQPLLTPYDQSKTCRFYGQGTVHSVISPYGPLISRQDTVDGETSAGLIMRFESPASFPQTGLI